MNFPNLYLDAFGLRLNNKKEELITSLGTPALQPITFLAKKYERFKDLGIRDFGYWDSLVTGKPQTEILAYDNFTLPASSIATFTRKKLISKTPFPNALSTMKEIYGFDDYNIVIRGFCLPEPKHPQGLVTPADQENVLRKWDEVMGKIDIEAEHFQKTRGIECITIESIEFPVLRGKPKIKPFVIRALATLPDEDGQPKI